MFASLLIMQNFMCRNYVSFTSYSSDQAELNHALWPASIYDFTPKRIANSRIMQRKKTHFTYCRKEHFLEHQVPFSSFSIHITVKNPRKWINEGQENNGKEPDLNPAINSPLIHAVLFEKLKIHESRAKYVSRFHARKTSIRRIRLKSCGATAALIAILKKMQK